MTMVKTAAISEDGAYRYLLARDWSVGDRILWIMLNPSTADANVDDPTIRRCIRFSRDWGFGSMEVVNLFALRSTDPQHLAHRPDADGGAQNRMYVLDAMADAQLSVAAWGAHKMVRSSKLRTEVEARSPWCLGVTKDGYPRHPLYVAAATEPVPLSHARRH